MARLDQSRRIAVIGAGISGLACAWLLSKRHDVTIYEAEDRLGGHSHTVDAPSPGGPVAVDTGFIVYNEPNYPNLTALFDHLGVATKPAPMSFAVSMDNGALEYSSDGLAGLFAQKSNLARPRFWGMVRDVLRFHRCAPADLAGLEGSLVRLEDYLARESYCAAFRDQHLLPQAAAIWSCSMGQMADYPAASFIRFYLNHRLLTVDTRPTWRTVDGGSRAYVQALRDDFVGRIEAGQPVAGVLRTSAGPAVRLGDGSLHAYDQVVLAVHSDQALRLLEAPTAEETRLLGAIRYGENRVVLHRDARLMPRRRAAWAAWNHLGRSGEGGEGGVTYWMNRLQSLPGPDLFVSLNPALQPRLETVIREDQYEHPIFDGAAIAAQKELWGLQGAGGAWFCGAWFGWGFHEDGLQAGLAVAEQLGGVSRPWTVDQPSSRIHVTTPRGPSREEAAA